MELSNRSAVLFTAAVGLTFTRLRVLATITEQVEHNSGYELVEKHDLR